MSAAIIEVSRRSFSTEIFDAPLPDNEEDFHERMTEHRWNIELYASQSQRAHHIAECIISYQRSYHPVLDECTFLARDNDAARRLVKETFFFCSAADNAVSHASLSFARVTRSF